MTRSVQLQVPKFGNWEGEGDVPYTVYFDEARRHRVSGEMRWTHGPPEKPEEFSNDESPARSGKEKSVEKHEDSEVPRFGDWDGGGDVPYTLYFDKVRRRRGSGKARTRENKSAEHARDDPPAREKPAKGKSPRQDLQGRRCSFVEHGKVKKDPTDQLRGSATASLTGTRKMVARRSPDSNRARIGVQERGSHPHAHANEKVVPSGASSEIGKWASSHTVSEGPAAASVDHSFYSDSRTKSEEKKKTAKASSEIGKWASSHTVSEGPAAASVDHSFYSDSRTKSEEKKKTAKKRKSCCFPWGGKIRFSS